MSDTLAVVSRPLLIALLTAAALVTAGGATSVLKLTLKGG